MYVCTVYTGILPPYCIINERMLFCCSLLTVTLLLNGQNTDTSRYVQKNLLFDWSNFETNTIKVPETAWGHLKFQEKVLNLCRCSLSDQMTSRLLLYTLAFLWHVIDESLWGRNQSQQSIIMYTYFHFFYSSASLPDRGDAICFELALAWKEVVGSSQNHSERTWEASPDGSALLRNQSRPSRCLITKKRKKKHVQYFTLPWRMFCTTFPSYQSYFLSHLATNNGKTANVT